MWCTLVMLPFEDWSIWGTKCAMDATHNGRSKIGGRERKENHTIREMHTSHIKGLEWKPKETQG